MFGFHKGEMHANIPSELPSLIELLEVLILNLGTIPVEGLVSA